MPSPDAPPPETATPRVCGKCTHARDDHRHGTGRCQRRFYAVEDGGGWDNCPCAAFTSPDCAGRSDPCGECVECRISAEEAARSVGPASLATPPGMERAHKCPTCGSLCVCAEFYDGDPCHHHATTARSLTFTAPTGLAGQSGPASLGAATPPETRMPKPDHSPEAMQRLDAAANSAAVEAARITMQRCVGLLWAARALVQKYGYGAKAGRPDYMASIPSDEFDVLTKAVEAYDAPGEIPSTGEAEAQEENVLVCLESVVEFAYEHGYHEHGIPLVGEVRKRLAELESQLTLARQRADASEQEREWYRSALLEIASGRLPGAKNAERWHIAARRFIERARSALKRAIPDAPEQEALRASAAKEKWLSGFPAALRASDPRGSAHE